MVLDDLVSGWSQVECTTPRVDPDPPVVEDVDIEQVKKLVKVELAIADHPREEHPVVSEQDRGVEPSGVADIRFDTTPSFEHATWGPVKTPSTTNVGNIALKWQPDQRRLTVSRKGLVLKNAPPLRREVWVQVRDAAGNESGLLPLVVTMP